MWRKKTPPCEQSGGHVGAQISLCKSKTNERGALNMQDYKSRVERIILNGERKRLPKKPRKPADPTKPTEPKESWEHAQLVKAMHAAELHFTHIPNEGKRSKWGGHHLFTTMGCRKAFPDFLIFNRPDQETAGIAIELKRVSKSSPKWGSPEQHQELILLASHGWAAYVCRGYKSALAVLGRHGLMDYDPEPDTLELDWRFYP
tara:strand:+ start:147 stop:755 length:609 start_codon:yes stop_codon:yes gene_type:complete